MWYGRVKLVCFTKSISDRRERIIGAVRHRMNSESQANRRSHRLLATFKARRGEFPSMIFNFLCNSTRVLCYTNIMLST